MARGKKKQKPQKRSALGSWLCSSDAYESLCVSGYARLSDNPEVQMAVNYVADLISSMTIHLMQNTGNGDIRVINGLSRKVDIEPCKHMTRKSWMFNIVRNMMLYGNQIVLPITSGGYIEEFEPLPPGEVSMIPETSGYTVHFRGRSFQPQEILHFLVNPDPEFPWRGMGYRVPLKDVARNLRQAAATKKGFMESKWKPSVIVRVDGLADEFASKTGRKKFMEEYLETDEAGEPWLVPAELLDIKEIKPLSLNDLALNDAVTLDKKTVAGILGVPPYVVGAGDYSVEEHRHFIDNYVRPKAQIIEQELTRKILYATDMYFWLNGRALYSYDIKELAEVGNNLYVRGIMTGNEVRNWINLPPRDGLDELVILENYIPRGMIGDQNKLKGGGGDE